ncbi:MAG: hypothetical protein J6W52_07675 [Bacteroidaceae bacterium]|nr:hypothetical protein [Bacteroidaceae bacterium]
MKRHLLLFLMTLLPFASSADTNGVNAMLLHVSSGQNWTIMLDEQPVLTFSDDHLVVSTHMSVVSFPSSLVTKFTYVREDDPTRINNAGQYGSVLSFSGNRISITNLTPSTGVQVYTVDGALVSSAITDSQGNVSLSVPEKAGNVYVIKTSTVTFKVRKP